MGGWGVGGENIGVEVGGWVGGGKYVYTTYIQLSSYCSRVQILCGNRCVMNS